MLYSILGHGARCGGWCTVLGHGVGAGEWCVTLSSVAIASQLTPVNLTTRLRSAWSSSVVHRDVLISG